MAAVRPIFLSRASNAFSSLAVTVALALLTILVLAIGSMRDSKAETTSALLLVSRVEDPALDLASASAVQVLPARGAEADKPQLISRRPLSVSSSKSRNRGAGPSQEWMGVSKLAFPLLVSDLVIGQAKTTPMPMVMTGRSVGAK
ncbi:MAG: hypothetical protein WCR51_08570 [Planctomycetia bacterium]